MILTWTLLLLLQDASPVPALFSKIDGRDPEACFQAIAELGLLGHERREEIVKGAGAIPDFYRQALLAELQAPAPKRVTLEGKDRSGPDWMVELGKAVGFSYWNPSDLEEGFGPAGTFDFAVKDVPILSALRKICAAGKCFPSEYYGYGKEDKLAFGATGSRAAAIRYYSSLEQSIRPEGRARWIGNICVDFLPDPGSTILEVRRIRLFEARVKGGGDATLGSPMRSNSVVRSERYALRIAEGFNSSCEIELDLPKRVDSIESLRFAADCLYATSITELVVPVDGEGKSEPVSKDGLTAELVDDLVLPRRGIDLRVRLTCKRYTPETMLKFHVDEDVEGATDVGARIEDARPDGEGILYRVVLWGDPKGPFKIKFRVATDVEERPVFAEFRDISLK